MSLLRRRSRDRWVQVGTVSVDSGQVCVVDPCYVVDGLDYEAVCALTGERVAGEWIAAGTHGTAVASTSGWGDGTYPVLARFEAGRVAELRVVFDAG